MAKKLNRKKLKLAPVKVKVLVTSDYQVAAEDWEVQGVNLSEGQMVVRESITYLKDAWRRL